jgi:hypothetical protein
MAAGMTVRPRPAVVRSRSLVLGVLALGVLTLGGCAAPPSTTSASPVASPAASATSTGPAVARVRTELARLLGTRNLVLTDVRIPFRPAESAVFATAPRAVYQVLLPADPSGGYISVYEFRDPDAAVEAAKSQFAYLQSGPGRVQSPKGTAHVIRQVGPTVVLYSWLPEAAEDPSTPRIAEALGPLGVGFDIET